MHETEYLLSVRTPSEILAMNFPLTDRFLPNGVFTKGQPFSIVGPAGVGKSRLALQLAVCIMTGKPFLGWPVQKHDMLWLIIQTENSNPRLQGDLAALRRWVGEKAWKDVERNLRIHTLEAEHDAFLTLDDTINSNLIYQAIQNHKPSVILFDPLNAFSSGNLNSDAGMLATCRGLQKLATLRDPSTSIVILHHSLAGRAGMKKAVGFDAGAYAKGSKAFTQWMRGQLNIARASDADNHSLVVNCGKNSNGPWFDPFGIMLDPGSMVYVPDPDFDLQSWKASVGLPSSPYSRPKLTTVAVASLAGPIPIKRVRLRDMIMEEYGVEKSRAYTLIDQAEVAKTIVRDGRKLYRATTAADAS